VKPKKKAKSKGSRAESGDDTGSVGQMLAAWSGKALTWTAVLAIAAACVGWVIGADALQARASQIKAEPVEVRFNWPEGSDGRTWIPTAVQRELIRIVEANLSTDPFDRDSIQRLHDRLKATGWFREIRALARKPGGIVKVDAVWRAPAAVVVRAGCEYLIGTDSAVMELPHDFKLLPSMFRIKNPHADPERDLATGEVLYGRDWPLDDVDHALRLIAAVSRVPEGATIVSVDLSEYPSMGHLLLTTDTGCVLNWGAPVDETVPGEATVDRKLVNLRTILSSSRRLDRGLARIDINRGHVVAEAPPKPDVAAE